MTDHIGTLKAAGWQAKKSGEGKSFVMVIENPRWSYNLFDPEQQKFAEDNLGSRVKIEYELSENGKFRNVKSISLYEEPAEASGYIAPQAVGLCIKEIGDNLRAGILTELFGDKTAESLVKWYRQQVLHITQIELPQSEPSMPEKSTREATKEESNGKLLKDVPGTSSYEPKEGNKPLYDKAKMVEDLTQLNEVDGKAWNVENILSFMKKLYKVEAPTVMEAVDKLDQGKLSHFLLRIEEALDK